MIFFYGPFFRVWIFLFTKKITAFPFYKKLLQNFCQNKVVRPYLYAGLTCLAFNISLLFYLTFILEGLYGLKEQTVLEERVPNAIPALLLAGVATFI